MLNEVLLLNLFKTYFEGGIPIKVCSESLEVRADFFEFRHLPEALVFHFVSGFSHLRSLIRVISIFHEIESFLP